MNAFSNGRFRAPLAALALVAIAACREPDLTETTPTAPADMSLQVSSGTARAGDQIAVALVIDNQSSDPIIGLQGRIRFDVNQLEYVGQEMGETFAIANDGSADRGAITFANLGTSGLRGRTAVFAFKVRSEGYLSGLRFELDDAATQSLKAARIRGGIPTVVAADLSVGEARRGIGLAEWRTRFGGEAIGPQRTPGDYRDNLRYGDADLNGSISIAGDAFYLASVSVGNAEVFINSEAAGAFGSIGKDAAIAGNVFPFNAPGLGEAGDALPPGSVSATNSGDISIFDASAVANEAVGNNQQVVGEIIPGRALVTRGRVVVSADITSNTTWTANTVYELAGVIRVNSGAVLTIEAGTQIEGQRPPTVAALYIEREGQIQALGTAREPIIFTCTGTDASKTKGCWAGLAIAGWAPINEGSTALGPAPAFGTRNPTGGQNQGQLEGNGPIYGGGNADDNSGTLKYVVIEYGGREVAPNN